MVPLSVLGKLRHELVERLDASLRNCRDVARHRRRRCARLAAIAARADATRRRATHQESTPPALHVLCRDLLQLDAVLDAGVDERLRRLPGHPRVSRRGAAWRMRPARRSIWPRRGFRSPAEGPLFKHLLRHGADGILVRNLAGLAFFARARRAAGRRLLAQRGQRADGRSCCRERGAQRVTASYDLNREQLLDLVAAVPPDVAGGRRPPAHADVPHGALRVLRGALAGHEQDQLRPAVRSARGASSATASAWSIRSRPTSAAATRSSTPCRRARPKSCRTLLAARRAALPHRAARTRRPPKCGGRSSCIATCLAGRTTGREVWTRLKALNHVGVTRGPLDT